MGNFCLLIVQFVCRLCRILTTPFYFSNCTSRGDMSSLLLKMRPGQVQLDFMATNECTGHDLTTTTWSYWTSGIEEIGQTHSKNDGQQVDQILHRVATKEMEEIKRTTMQKMAGQHTREGGNHLEQENNRQKAMEDTDGGLHPAVDGQSSGERCEKLNQLIGCTEQDETGTSQPTQVQLERAIMAGSQSN